jgi:hypothetical protein
LAWRALRAKMAGTTLEIIRDRAALLKPSSLSEAGS